MILKEHKSWKTHTIYFMEKHEFSAYIEKPSFRYESEHRERGEEKLTEEEEEEEETQMTKKRPNRRREKPFQSPSNHIIRISP